MIGKWEKVHYGDYPFLAKCSRCGHEIDTHYEGKYPNFCSNCGLPMNEEAARKLNNVLYLCDKQNPECGKTNCSGDFCHHTSDVNHAVNFTPIVGQDSGEVIGYMEKESVETTSSEWIPTSEMLPEKYDSYLVMWRSLTEGFPDRLFYEICEYYPEEDEWERIEQVGEAGAEIVAWMPLPEPYEKGGEKE